MRDDVLSGFQDDDTSDGKPERILPEQLDRVPDPILVADDDRKYVDVNRAAVKILGGTRETIIGRSIDDFFSEADSQPIPDVWAKFIGTGDLFGTCKLRGGSIFAYRSRANFKPGLHICVLRRIR